LRMGDAGDQREEESVAQCIYERIEPNTDGRFEAKFFVQSIKTLIEVAYNFADEQLEGRKITYGLILGNKGLLDFMDGRKNIAPIALRRGPVGSGEPVFARISDLTENVHLLANHTKRAIVVPYLPEYALGYHEPVPFF